MTNALIDQYLESKKNAWAASTLRSERYRLAAVSEYINGDAQHLWDSLADYAPYARATAWTRVTAMWQWAADRGIVSGNPYRRFREDNARLFKNAYVPKKPAISFEEAEARVARIGRETSRLRARQLLLSGMRFTESGSFDGETVTGKGSKIRRVYLPAELAAVDSDVKYMTFWRDLRAVGITPHMLRKLFLSRCAEQNFNEHELCEVAGWASIQTATSYIKVNSDRLKERVARIQGGGDNADSGVKVS